MEEAELTFFAQDNDGNVWHLGQYSEIYKDEEFVGGKAGLCGHLDGARPGIFMKAEPAIGESYYSQEFAPAPYFWSDLARGIEMVLSVTVAQGEFDEVLLSEETGEEELELGFFSSNIMVKALVW